MSKIDKVQQRAIELADAGKAAYEISSTLENEFNVGVYVDSASCYNVSRLGRTHNYFEIYYKRAGTWFRYAGRFFIVAKKVK